MPRANPLQPDPELDPEFYAEELAEAYRHCADLDPEDAEEFNELADDLDAEAGSATAERCRELSEAGFGQVIPIRVFPERSRVTRRQHLRRQPIRRRHANSGRPRARRRRSTPRRTRAPAGSAKPGPSEPPAGDGGLASSTTSRTATRSAARERQAAVSRAREGGS